MIIKHPHATPHHRRANPWLRYGIMAAFMLIIAVGQISLLFNSGFTIFANLAAFMLLIGAGLFLTRVEKPALLLAILPFINLVMLVIPSEHVGIRITAYYLFLLAFAFTYRFGLLRGHAFLQHKPGRALRVLAMVIFVGLSIGIMAAMALKNEFNWLLTVPLVVLMPAAIIMAITEELYLRRLVMEQTARAIATKQAMLLTIAIYMLMVVPLQSILAIVVAGIAGAALVYTYRSTTNIVSTITMNIIMKLTFIVTLGFI